MTIHVRRSAGVGAATAVLAVASVAGASAATAQENLRGSVSFPLAPVVECDGGVVIGLGFDVEYGLHWTYSDTGELVQERLVLRYTGHFENLDTGERSVPVRGTGNAVTDFVSGTRTVSGSGRSMTMPGVGKILHEAGHAVLDHASGEVLVSHGPAIGESTPEGARRVCTAMGLTGGLPLLPPDVHD